MPCVRCVRFNARVCVCVCMCVLLALADVCAASRDAEKLAYRPDFAVMNHRGMYIHGGEMRR